MPGEGEVGAVERVGCALAGRVVLAWAFGGGRPRSSPYKSFVIRHWTLRSIARRSRQVLLRDGGQRNGCAHSRHRHHLDQEEVETALRDERGASLLVAVGGSGTRLGCGHGCSAYV